jgi:hypothetical protein
MIRIEKPLVLLPQNDGCVVELLLHVSEKDELFYFTKERESERIVMNILNNKACVNGTNLKPLTTNIDKPPISLKIMIDDPDTSYLLKTIFNRPFKEHLFETDKKTPCLALPRLIYRGDQ